ncbi:MAG: ribonuclease P protein component [Georgfuchsia sp.]
MSVAEFCFRPQHRLLQSAEYTGVFGQRRVLRGSLLDLHFKPGTAESARLGLVIPKRNAALSVTRNYCKRVARELFRQRRAGLPVMDLVLRLARPVKLKSREFHGLLGPALREDFDKLLKRLPR